jgi:uroporphyrin-III C-methyltransferase
MARMSQDDTSDSSVPVQPTPAAAFRPEARATVPPRPVAHGSRSRRSSGHGGTIALALLLALIAVAVAGYVGWRQWTQEQANASDSRAVATLEDRVGTLEGALESVTSDRSLLRQRLGDAEQVNRSLREELLGQSDRLRDLEDAVTNLSQKNLSGHDTLLLDETEALLRMAQQRYALFHDAQGAAAAYALAEQSLAAVDDGAFSGLRQSIEAEREALMRSEPRTREGELATLQQLRDQLPRLPLKPSDRPPSGAAEGAWARVGHALASVISVRRDSGAPLAVTDARLTRELVALDLAQAEAAVLAWDDEAATAAVRRVDAGLAAQFDDGAVAVKQARATLASLLASLRPAAPVQLGGALTELRNLRAVHALKPVDATSPAAGKRARAPATAASAGARP